MFIGLKTEGIWRWRICVREFRLTPLTVSISVCAPPASCVPSWRSQSSSQRRSPSSLGTSFIHVSDLFLPPLPPRIHTAFITEGNENGIYTVEPNMHWATRVRYRNRLGCSLLPLFPIRPPIQRKGEKVNNFKVSQSRCLNTVTQKLSLVLCKLAFTLL